MPDLDKKYYFAIAQQSFSLRNKTYSKVIPIADADGNVVNNGPEEFPNYGSVSWTLKDDVRLNNAPPGCLILSGIEHSTRPDEDAFQVLQPALPSFNDLLEIVTPDTPIDDPNVLLDNFQIHCDHEPTNRVLVKIDNFVFGPFQANNVSRSRARRIDPDIYFSKPAVPGRVYKIPTSKIDGLPGYFSAESVVQRGNKHKPSTNDLHQVQYEAVTRELFDKLCTDSEEIDIVSLFDAVNRISKEYLNRGQRRGLLDNLKRYCDGSQEESYLVERVRKFYEQEGANLSKLDELINALLQDEQFQDLISKSLNEKVEELITHKTATISASAEDRIKAISRELVEMEEKRRNAEAIFEAEREEREQNLRIDLDKEREESNKELDRKKRELDDQKKMIDEDISAAVDLLTNERAKILANFISLQPLVQQLGVSDSGKFDIHGLPSPPAEHLTTAGNALQPPPALDRSKGGANAEPLPEGEFFDRFKDHVSNCGFIYDLDDLIAFHLSAKEQSPVILYGAAGTGKSSLPVLYTESLTGETAESDRFLNVDVNPSWTNFSDLIGYPDAFEHRFIPASSGLFNHLIKAQQYYKMFEGGAHIFTVCLEEINLAQPEFYLQEIIQAISRGPERRTVRFFDPMAVRPDDPYYPYAKLDIAPNVNFVGTMNLDETTHKLSKRLLDRCNLIYFGTSGRLHDFSQEATTGAKPVEGRPIQQSDRVHWTKNSNPPVQLYEILDLIQPELHALGCGLTQRRQSSIIKFVANSENVCPVEKAIDLQLELRVVPQIRNLHTSRAEKALDGLLYKIEHASVNAERTVASLTSLREERTAFDTPLDDE